jgi:hypothetical protein
LAPNGIGVVQSNVSIVPNTSNIRNLGSATRRWSSLYVQYANISGNLDLAGTFSVGDLTVSGNLTVTGNTIQIGNLITDAKTIQLANTASTANAANGSGMTVGSNDNIATMLYSSATNAWTFNIGLDAPNIVVNNITSDDSTFVTVQDGLDVQGDITAETLSVAGNITGGNLLAPGAVIATLLTGGNLQVTGGVSGSTMTAVANVTGGNILTSGLVSATGNITGNYILGNISQASGFPATYGNANVATFLAAYGSNTISTAGNITGNYFVGNGSLLTSLTGANVTGTVANATSATTAGTVTSNAQANITSVGTLTSLSSSGNITGGNVLTGGLISATGNITGGNISTGKITLTNGAVIKDTAGNAVAIGQSTGLSAQGSEAVAIGSGTGIVSQGSGAVAISGGAGAQSQGFNAVAIGMNSGYASQGQYSVAIGRDAGSNVQGANSIAIGNAAGYNNQGVYAIAIGTQAGYTGQGNNSIILNATAANLDQTTANTFTVAPVRNDVANVGQVMFYNTSSKEITYGNAISVAGNVTGSYVLGNGSQLTSLPAPTVTQDIASTGAMSIMTYDGNLKYVSYATVEPASGNITGGNISATGNITGNYIFGNGSQLTGITANTGNVTFSNQIVLGTGTNDGSGGLYLAPGTDSIANSAVQYLRVRGGDYPTHIHLDTGNNAYYDQYFGADTKYVKLEANGNIVINADDGANSATWTFDNTGNLTIPGGMIINGNTNTLGSQTALLQPTDDLPLAFISSGANGSVISYWAEDVANLMTSNIAAIYTPLQNTQTVRIVTGTNGGNIAIYDFDNAGMFTAAAVCATGNVYAGNVSASGNVTGGNLVTAGSGGNITMTGGNITGANVVSANTVSATGNITGAYLFGNGSQLTGITASVPSQTILPTIQTITVEARPAGLFGGGQGGANVTVANTIPVTEYGVIITDGTTSEKYKTGSLGSIPGTVSLTFTTGLNSAQFTVFAYVTSNAGTYYSNSAIGTSGICLLAGTQIALSDGTRKAIEHITYTDKMLSWDFDRGCYAETTAVWIKCSETGSQYNLLTFSDGTTLRTFDQHRIFNKQAGAFTYPMTDATPIGTVTVNEHGQEITLTNKQVIVDTIEYYNVITDHHMNLFSDTVLTSCRFNNIYPITDMKFVKDGRTLRTRAEFENIPDRFFYGLRLAEQTTDIETVEWYVNRLLSTEVSTESELTV